jgi:hypothetical protein
MPNLYYVSPRATGGANNGLTEANAFLSMNSAVGSAGVAQPGDVVLFDRGPTGGTLEYPELWDIRKKGTEAAPIFILGDTTPGRNGKAIVFGGRRTSLPEDKTANYSPVIEGTRRDWCISFHQDSANAAQHVILDSRGWGNGGASIGLKCIGARKGAVRFGSNNLSVRIRHLELEDCGDYYQETDGFWYCLATAGPGGVQLAGKNTIIERVWSHNHANDGFQSGGIGTDANILLFECVASNERQHSNGTDIPWNNKTHPDGLQIFNGGLNQSKLTVKRSVFGPGYMQNWLPSQILNTQNQQSRVNDVFCEDVLFYGANNQSLLIGDYSGDLSHPELRPERWHFKRCTFDRKTSGNRENVKFVGTSITVEDCVNTGGTGNTIDAAITLVGTNVEFGQGTYRDGGIGVNTNPQYANSSVSGSRSFTADFAFLAGGFAAANNIGSRVTSIAQLLNAAPLPEVGAPPPPSGSPSDILDVGAPISYGAGAAATSHTPASIQPHQEGDFFLLVADNRVNSQMTVAGWTKIPELSVYNSGSTSWTEVWKRRVGAGETVAAPTIQTTSSKVAAILRCFRSVDPTVDLDVAVPTPVVQTTNSATITAPSVTTATDKARVLFIVGGPFGAYTFSWTGATLVANAGTTNSGGNTSISVAEKTQTTAGSSGTATANTGGSQSPLTAMTLALRPAPQVTVPAQPSISVITATATTISVAWGDISGETAYEVAWRKDGTSYEAANSLSVGANVLSALIPDLDPLTTYKVRVRGIGTGGPGSWSNEATITTGKRTKTLGTITAGAFTSLLTASKLRTTGAYTMPEDGTFDNGIVFRLKGGASAQVHRAGLALDDGTILAVGAEVTIAAGMAETEVVFPCPATYIKAGSAIRFVLWSGLTSQATTAYYSSQANGLYSADVSYSQAGAPPATMPTDAAILAQLLTAYAAYSLPTRPGVPTNLHATIVSSTRVELTWTPVAMLGQSFVVERVVRNGQFETLAIVETPSYTDLTIPPGQPVRYRVKARTSGGDSDYSNEVAVQTPRLELPTIVSGLPEYVLRAYSPSGQKRAETSEFLDLVGLKRRNAPGTITPVFASDDPFLRDIQFDDQIELHYRHAAQGIPWTRELVGIYEDDVDEEDENGVARVTLSCPGILSLLGWRHILYPADLDGYTRFVDEPVETIMLRLVATNATANATTANGRDRDGALRYTITVAADGERGPRLDWSCTRKNVLSELQALAQATGATFDLVKVAPTQFEFRYLTPENNVVEPVVFASERGNIAKPKLVRSRSGQKTVAIVGGQGQGATRTVIVVPGADYSANNDRETFVDGRDSDSADVLTSKGQAATEAARAKTQLSFGVIQTPDCTYGQHYQVADPVIGRHRGMSVVQRVESVTHTFDNDKPTIDVEIADVAGPIANGPLEQLAIKMQAINARIAALETQE